MLCRICNSDKSRLLFRKLELEYYQCQICKNIFIGNNYAVAEIKRFYDYYSSNYDDLIIENSLGLLKKTYAKILDIIEKYRQTNNILDIGAGRGHFMKDAQERGWNVFGTEFSESAYNIGKKSGLNLYLGDISEINFSNGMFDAVTLWEVLEHCYCPSENLKVINKILRMGGAVFITTPNYNSLTRRIVGKHWCVFQREHLSIFKTFGLKYILNKYYFHPARVVTENISLGEISSFFINNKADGIDCDQNLRKIMDSRFYFRCLKVFSNYLLNAIGCGDTIKAIFVKVKDI